MLLNYVLRQGYQALKRYVLLFLALIPYILPIIPQININISSIPQKGNDSFRSFVHYFNIWPDSIYIFPFANDVASTAISFPPPKAKRKQLMYLPCAGNWKLRKDYIGGETIETIYFGGGTPSQLSQEDFISIFSHIYKVYNVEPDAEITLEANPDDLTPEYITMLRSLPFNRLSMGIQTFNEDMLKLLQRRHTADRAIHAFNNCRRAGFHNISIDLMYGLPGENTRFVAKRLGTGSKPASRTHLRLSSDIRRKYCFVETPRTTQSSRSR